jgi:hypothetical protein
MTPTAVTFLFVAALIIWGGLAVSIVLLRRDGAVTHDDVPGEEWAADPTAGPPAGPASPSDGRAG